MSATTPVELATVSSDMCLPTPVFAAVVGDRSKESGDALLSDRSLLVAEGDSTRRGDHRVVRRLCGASGGELKAERYSRPCATAPSASTC